MQRLLDEVVELGVLSLPPVEQLLDFPDRTERRAREDAAGRARLQLARRNRRRRRRLRPLSTGFGCVRLSGSG
jgi:hypothetical protein